ncbi:DUF3159 domain-containing protein [Streptomyces sp. NBC_01696]|uniref:DUF3159 domain-containing protein n=1 Tax=Streptomyces sp. NBC_01696 TaxID=2975913 RepID=UPI002E37011D|nr:DUF3159 domain-containing protein [Streptomyces sp. NBC_01696]
MARLVRGERLLAASGSLTGVLVAAGIVALTGSAKDFFLLGIWVAFAGFLVTFGSVLLRRPLTGVAWNLLHGGTHAWRADRQVLRAHDIATLAAASVLGARFVVKQWLYVHDATGWLAFAKIAMGTPLTVVAALVVAWAFRATSKRLMDSRPIPTISQEEAELPLVRMHPGSKQSHHLSEEGASCRTVTRKRRRRGNSEPSSGPSISTCTETLSSSP